MSDLWAASIPLAQLEAAAPLRLQAGVEACVEGERLWLRGTQWDASLDRTLRKILGAARYHRLPERQTAEWGCTLASGTEPAGPWTAFRTWLQPAAPRTALAATIGLRAEVRLVRTTVERTANLLVVPFEAWRDYAVAAPLVRLRHLSFAASEDGLALVRGEPLPPLLGTMYVEETGVAVPLGWTWSPAVSAKVLRKSLALEEGDVALLTTAGECEVIGAQDFVRATRSAVRLTEEAIGGQA